MGPYPLVTVGLRLDHGRCARWRRNGNRGDARGRHRGPPLLEPTPCPDPGTSTRVGIGRSRRGTFDRARGDGTDRETNATRIARARERREQQHAIVDTPIAGVAVEAVRRGLLADAAGRPSPIEARRTLRRPTSERGSQRGRGRAWQRRGRHRALLAAIDGRPEGIGHGCGVEPDAVLEASYFATGRRIPQAEGDRDARTAPAS
jgi:hypothetical protein